MFCDSNITIHYDFYLYSNYVEDMQKVSPLIHKPNEKT